MVTSALHARLKAAETQSLVFWWNGVDCEKIFGKNSIPKACSLVEALVLSSKCLFFSFLAKLTEKPHAGVSKAST